MILLVVSESVSADGRRKLELGLDLDADVDVDDREVVNGSREAEELV